MIGSLTRRPAANSEDVATAVANVERCAMNVFRKTRAAWLRVPSRARIDAMDNLNDPLAVLATRWPCVAHDFGAAHMICRLHPSCLVHRFVGMWPEPTPDCGC